MGCQKCWPALAQEEIDRRQLPCRQQCIEEGGCARCAAVKETRETSTKDLLSKLRGRVLAIYGQAGAFNLLDDTFDHGDVKAAKDTGLMIGNEAIEALKILNELQNRER